MDVPVAVADDLARAARIAAFRRRAVPAILVLIAVFSAGALVSRALAPEKDGEAAQFARLVGEPFFDVTVVFGHPAREESDGRGGWIMHYNDFQVVDSRFTVGSYRIFVGSDGRVDKFERD